jgi:putative MATE family efflux protein
MILEMVMESIFAVVDVFWVGHLGSAAVATVALTEAMMMIVYSLAKGMSIGVVALVARRIGEKDRDAAARAATQGIVMGLTIALAMGVAGVVFAQDLLLLMGADSGVVALGSGFTRVMLGGNATVFLLILINAIFRGSGDAAHAMRVLWLGNALNIVLCPCFIFGWGPFPELGVLGAALGTTIGRGIAVISQFYILSSDRSQIGIAWRDVNLDFRLTASVLRLSGSAVLQILIPVTSFITVIRILSTFGSAPVAGYTIGLRLLMFATLPVVGLANAAATLVGQNLGARRPDRSERAVWEACRLAAGFLSLVGVAFLIGAPLLVRFFTTDPDVTSHAATYLRILGLGFPLYAFGMVVSQAFNGAGDARTPTFIQLFVSWLLRVPLAWTLSRHANLGPLGVYIALALSNSVFAVVSVGLFRRGAWKRTHV